MILMDAMDVLYDLDDEQREVILQNLLPQLSQTSHYVIGKFQAEWSPELGDYKTFTLKQNRLIEECVKAELTDFGCVVRTNEGLEPLSRLTTIM